MQKEIRMIRQFTEIFKKYSSSSSNPNLNIPESVLTLRRKLIEEETKEVFDAIRDNDLINTGKEISDLIYVVFGLIVELGFDDIIEDIFKLVHESNMSKLDNDGNPILRSDGKIIKGPNYKEPYLNDLFPKVL